MKAIVMETNFILLIVFILISIFWFSTMTEIKMGRHKKAYGVGVVFIIFACISRIFCIYIDYQAENMTINQISVSHMIYLIFLMLAYASYGYQNLCFMNYNVRWRKTMIYLYFIPCVISIIMLIISRYTGLVYTVDESGYGHGPFHFIVAVEPVVYCLPGLVELIFKRRYLPRNLINCTIGTIVGFLMGLIAYSLTGSKSLLFAVIVLVLLIQLFAILFYDAFWDEESSTMNQKAFDFYLKRYVEKGKTMDIILIQIVGFQYFRDSRDTEMILKLRVGLADDLKTMIRVNTIYYLGNGAYVVAIDEEEKRVDKAAFMQKLLTYCNQSSNTYMQQLSPDIDISLIKVPEDVTDPSAIYAFVKREKDIIEVREEKVVFRQGAELHLDKALRMEKVLQAISRAVSTKAFDVYYQPIYDTNKHKISSAEALIRLKDEELGFIPPDEFIPLAEKKGMIMDIGMQVFDSVCRFIEKNDLTSLGVEYIEINVSIGQFLDDSLAHKFDEYMRKHNISYNQINLEITETAMPFEENRMRAQLKRMADMGFRFSLDDYGTGYSNMEAVTEYPLEMIKLDKSIVWSAFKEEKAMITMKNLINMFHSLGFKIVAEGVENEEMVKGLLEIHCDYLQGYYYSKPLCESDFMDYLRKQREEAKMVEKNGTEWYDGRSSTNVI